jgi:hypothetical protein
MKKTYDCLIYKDATQYRILMVEKALGMNLWHQNADIPKTAEALKKWNQNLENSFSANFGEQDEFILHGNSVQRTQIVNELAKILQ